MFLFAEGGEHHQPLIVEFINHYLGEPVYQLQLKTTKPMWEAFFAKFGTTPEKVFGVGYSPETAIPWYLIMFVIACLLTVFVVYLLKGKLSDDDPNPGQLTLEAGYLAIKDMSGSIIGDNGARHFPVVATFGLLILVSNLMSSINRCTAQTPTVLSRTG